jgi:hypothetical protein
MLIAVCKILMLNWVKNIAKTDVRRACPQVTQPKEIQERKKLAEPTKVCFLLLFFKEKLFLDLDSMTPKKLKKKKKMVTIQSVSSKLEKLLIA